MKRFFLVVISLSLIISMSLCVSAENIIADTEYKNEKVEIVKLFSPDEEVTFIVEVEGDAVLARNDVKTQGVQYLETNQGKSEEKFLIQTQEKVLSSIKEENIDAQTGFTYTVLFNGFSIKGKYSDLETIKNISGVKSVYISEEFEIEPHLSTAVGLTGSLPEQTSGYLGKGQTVAIIDSEFDVNHEFFSASIDDEKFSSGDIQTLMSKKILNADASYTQVYKNEKIPFAYNYVDKNTYVYSADYVHGTHVAGIVGGKNGKKADGTSYSGVAPEVQLVLMKVGNDEGKMSTDAVMAALEDVAKIGVCAVNCSFGIEYASPQAVELLSRCYETIYNSGILLSASSGNSKRGYAEKTPLTKNIDYSTSGVPGNVSASFSVASAQNRTSGTVNEVSSFSSYGVNESLELKPDITAIGGRVYSSVPDGKYENKSGTSMSAPHITGIVALMNEYFDEKYPEILGKTRVDLIQNMLMSSATPILRGTTDIPYSPRVQGAGMVNTVNAMNTPVILIGDNGKTKLSLKDGLESTINLNFKVQNLTDADITFGSITIDVLTDGYTKNASDNKYYVSDTKRFKKQTISQSVTVKANSVQDVSLTVELDSNLLSQNAQIFKNGFFIDGFIRLEDTKGEITSVGIPFTGFYGDWTKAPVFDASVYDEGGSVLIDDEGNGGTYLVTQIGEGFYRTGYSSKSGLPDKNYLSASPNGDLWGDSLYLVMTPMRTISEFYYTVTDKNGNTVIETENSEIVVNKFYEASCSIDGLSSLKNGDYTVNFYAKCNYEKNNATVHTLSMPFYIDTQKPSINNVSISGNVLTVSVRDNRYIEYVNVSYPDTTGEIKSGIFFFPEHISGGGYKLTFTLEDLDTGRTDEIEIDIVDYAKNYYSNTFSCLKGQIVPVMTKFDYLSGMLSTSFNVINKGAKVDSCSVLLAFYDTNGKLVYTHNQTETINAGNDTLSFNMFADLLGAKLCRMYIWDNQGKLVPLDTDKMFNISSLLE